MKVSTSINLFFDHSFTVPVQEQIQRVYDAGFRHMDMNFWDWCHDPASPFRADDWEKWVTGIREKSDSLSVRFTQAHAHVYNFYDHPDDALPREMYLRSLKGAAMLNVPWVTFHGCSSEARLNELGRAQIQADNIEFFKPLVQLAGELGTGVALENLIRCYQTADELIEAVDALSPYGPVGVCWDTGHAHLNHVPQGESIRKLGSRLHALHVQDSDGLTDQHTAPFYGTIDWAELMDALRATSYSGDFTYEAHNLVRPVPNGAKAAAAHLLYAIGEELVSI